MKTLIWITQSRLLLSTLLLSTFPLASPRAFADPTIPAAETLRAQIVRYGEAGVTAPGFRPGLIRHVVFFRYAPEVTPAQKREVRDRFLALAQLCNRQGRPYIQAIETGAQSSAEGVDQSLEQAFIVTFASEGDRNYYVGAPLIRSPRLIDPAHDAFKRFVGPLLHQPVNPTGVVVFDYRVGS